MNEQGCLTGAWELVKGEYLLINQEQKIVSQSTTKFETEADAKFEQQLMEDLELYDQESE